MEKLKIIHEKENPMFSRKELVVEISRETSPKRTDMENVFAEKFSASVDNIKIDRIIPKFGSDIFTIHARIYKSKEDKETIEPKIKEAKIAK
jgi:ribosomal protein S24E